MTDLKQMYEYIRMAATYEAFEQAVNAHTEIAVTRARLNEERVYAWTPNPYRVDTLRIKLENLEGKHGTNTQGFIERTTPQSRGGSNGKNKTTDGLLRDKGGGR